MDEWYYFYEPIFWKRHITSFYVSLHNNVCLPIQTKNEITFLKRFSVRPTLFFLLFHNFISLLNRTKRIKQRIVGHKGLFLRKLLDGFDSNNMFNIESFNTCFKKFLFCLEELSKLRIVLNQLIYSLNLKFIFDLTSFNWKLSNILLLILN